jgi:REP element-mobilizing transposase RayT
MFRFASSDAATTARPASSALLRWLDEALHNRDCQSHAYVRMTNHVHLLLTPKKPRSFPGS